MYNKYLKRREMIIIDAVDLLDELGIKGLTTKELARREGITEPAIYKQFDSKQDIILTVLERFASFDEVIQNTILEQKMPCREALAYYVGSYASYYHSYPQITTILFSLDVFQYELSSRQKMRNIIDNRYNFMAKLLEQGLKTGELICTMAAEELTELVMGILWGITWRWKMTDTGEDLKAKILSALNKVLEQK
ncbi:TetR/AcrR family transcriptional regulator [Desulfosporosinus sp. Sb-LF]|uniref:TetR/AcrR family transcriptional regulator n=1 Tax=Desulfosporosinus sp. Sb-LF TaxID=2560027 RepID=UPI00107F33CE|nr:TetR/AcrR family transcriptional regulator [Desulfosporosinus sp. Sb-LF]TGE32935.1 TetR/AcrR family transcriptional regulator [Desulfosporosinus sp. Sb-LF]